VARHAVSVVGFKNAVRCCVFAGSLAAHRAHPLAEGSPAQIAVRWLARVQLVLVTLRCQPNRYHLAVSQAQPNRTNRAMLMRMVFHRLLCVVTNIPVTTFSECHSKVLRSHVMVASTGGQAHPAETAHAA
jgi:hypothetical protein